MQWRKHLLALRSASHFVDMSLPTLQNSIVYILAFVELRTMFEKPLEEITSRYSLLGARPRLLLYKINALSLPCVFSESVRSLIASRFVCTRSLISHHCPRGMSQDLCVGGCRGPGSEVASTNSLKPFKEFLIISSSLRDTWNLESGIWSPPAFPPIGYCIKHQSPRRCVSKTLR